VRAAEQAPQSTRFGEGREAKIMYGRDVDEDSVPWIHVGGGIYTTDEQIYLDTVEGLASINIVDSLSVPSILHLRGKNARVRSPQELLSGHQNRDFSPRRYPPFRARRTAHHQRNFRSVQLGFHDCRSITPVRSPTERRFPYRFSLRDDGQLRGIAKGGVLQQHQREYRLNIDTSLWRICRWG